MATIVLSAVGAGIGGSIGGSVLGLSAAVLGRAVGATLGQAIDQRLMGSGSQVVESGRVERFRLTGASEGTAIAQVYGRMRVAGQVIWASNFQERRSSQRSGSGKGVGGGGGATVRSYSYSVSLAIALCEGEISHVGRIWADGMEVSRNSLALRVYSGREDQSPDPKISAVEGVANAPAYRGTAYVVVENLDLGPFGNRVPQFSFEVVRPEQISASGGLPSLTQGVQGVALIPGTGEYSLATTPVHYVEGPGRKRSANVNNGDGVTDFLASVNALETELPNCGAVSLVVSWFGDDLRCGQTQIRPKVEHKLADGFPMQWRVSGIDRVAASLVSQINGRPVYGGTPTDASVIEAIQNLRGRGKKVMFYPFILMEQLPGNSLTDPWTGAGEQAPLPWRGRITTSLGPGLPGSPDGSAAAAAEVANFFGTAAVTDFAINGGQVTYTGPQEWSLRRFILHYAALCAAAGGVDAFCIGSEMRGLTQVRGPGNSFPAVDEFVRLSDDVRMLLGPAVKIGYAADWSEYFGYTPLDGSGDRFFHLDPLWAHDAIDFIGIDNYMPLSDWREGDTHADAQAGWETIYDIDYLKANIAGGEGYDWYYPDEQAASTQARVPITDGAYGEPWVYRYKDLVSWWSNAHHDRIGGIRQASATAWVPGSKPIWFTELGCAALDKATNQPNKFLDPKSSESVLPRASNGDRDDLIQMQYLRAMFDFWANPANNPVSGLYGGAMVDMQRAHIWAWDARPFPWFPGLPEVWSDGDNYTRGHWLNGRTGSQLLSTVVREICQNTGVADADVSRLYGLVRGYGVAQPVGARQALEPLMVSYGFSAHERDGKLLFRNRSARIDKVVERGDLTLHPESDGDLTTIRASDADMAGRVRLSYVASDGSFEVQAIEAVYPGAEARSISASEVNLVLTEAEARAMAERWLAESRLARDSAKFALPPSAMALGPGDVVAVPGPGSTARYRLDRSEQMGLHLLEAVRVEPEVYLSADKIERLPVLRTPVVPLPPTPIFLDLPLLTGAEVPHAPYLAVAATPWPGEIAVFDSVIDSDYRLNSLIGSSASIGVTQNDLSRAAPGVLDRGTALRVQMSDGSLSSVPRADLLAGANAMAIGDGSPGNWEVFQFEQAELVGPNLFDLSRRLRGQLGTDAMMPDVWPVGSLVVLLEGSLQQIELSSGARGLERHYRIGPASLPYDDPSFVHRQDAFEGVGLRPYSPVHLRWQRNAAGTDRISWVRRSRVDGDLWSLAQTPLGEATEAYVVRVLVGGVVRREQSVTSPEWFYSPVERAADGVAGQYNVAVAQISDRFGAGLFGKMVING